MCAGDNNVNKIITKTEEDETTSAMTKIIIFTVRSLIGMRSVRRHRLASGTSEKIQLSSLIAAFQVARDLVAMEAE